MILIIIYILSLLIIWRLHKRISFFADMLYVVYIVSAICGLLLVFYRSETNYVSQTESYIPLFFLLLIVVLWNEPYVKLSTISLDRPDRDSSNYFDGISTIVCAYFFPLSLLLFYNSVTILTTVDVSVFRIEADYYSYFWGGIFFSLGVYSSMLSFIPQFLFFLSYRYHVPRVKRFILLFSSFSFTFMTLCFAGRDGIVYWLLNSIVFYYFLRDSYNITEKRRVRNVFYLVAAIILVVFIFITFSRFILGGHFGNGDSIVLPLIDYLGQPIHIFCQSLSLSPEQLRNLDSTNYLISTFGTFVKALYMRHGYYLTIIISLLQFLIVRGIVQVYNRSHNIWDLMIIYLVFQIPLYGVFYYRQGIQSMEIVYLVALGLFLILKLFHIKPLKI